MRCGIQTCFLLLCRTLSKNKTLHVFFTKEKHVRVLTRLHLHLFLFEYGTLFITERIEIHVYVVSIVNLARVALACIVSP